MNLKGTKFQLKVWNYLKKIPKGKVKTYLEVAKPLENLRLLELLLMQWVKTPILLKYPVIE